MKKQMPKLEKEHKISDHKISISTALITALFIIGIINFLCPGIHRMIIGSTAIIVAFLMWILDELKEQRKER